MSSEAQPRSIGRRIFWVIRTTLLWLFIMALLIGLGYLGYLGVLEAQRSLNSVAARVEANSRTITELSDEMRTARESANEQQNEMQTMSRSMDDLGSRLGNVELTVAEDLAARLTRQEELLAGLEAQMADASSSDETALGDIASLGEAVTALQTDLNSNSSQIDALGGAIDRLDNAVEAMSGQTAVLETSVTDLQATVAEDPQGDEVREVLALFHVWELITRARLRLAENNIGLAQTDVETAVRTLDRLAVAAETADLYATVQGRLALAFANLPNDPTTASADLETAWDELDTILADKILPERTFELTTPEPTDGEPTPTPTPAP